MKKFLSLLLSLLLVFSSAACGSSQSQTAPDGEENLEPTRNPRDLAEESDRMLSTTCKLATALMDSLIEKDQEFTSHQLTKMDYVKYCKHSMTVCNDTFSPHLEEVPDYDGTEDYRKEVETVITNVWSAHNNMVKYLEDGKGKNYDRVVTAIQCHLAYVDSVNDARQDYLANAGLTNEDIDAICTENPLVRPAGE